MFDPKERTVAAERARKDFYFFARWMFLQRTHERWQRAPHHELITQRLVDVFEGRITRLIINIPPRYSKTQLVCDFVAWSLGHYPDSEYIYTSYAGTLAENNNAAIRATVMHPAYREIFPEVQLTKLGQADWRTSHGGICYAAGFGGSILGFGAGKFGRSGFGGAAIIDDPTKPEEARNPEQLAKDIRALHETIERRLNDPKRTPIVLIMQRLAEGDLSGYLQALGGWDACVLPALQEDGTSLWPEKFTAEQLHVMQRQLPYMFAGQYQQSPAAAAGNIFTPDSMPIFEAVPFGTKFCRGWDLGASDKDGDPTAGMKLGLMPDGRWIIADVVKLMGRPDAVQSAVVNTAARDGQTVEISIPQDPGQAGKAQVAAFGKLLAGYKVHASPETGDKVTRAEPFAAQVNVGNVVMLRAEWNDALTSEMRLFPNGKHDDQVDAGSRAFNRLARKGQWALGSM